MQVTERIRSGTSLLIFPEGTRSSTQRLGRLKGAFHMAMEAGCRSCRSSSATPAT